MTALQLLAVLGLVALAVAVAVGTVQLLRVLYADTSPELELDDLAAWQRRQQRCADNHRRIGTWQ